MKLITTLVIIIAIIAVFGGGMWLYLHKPVEPLQQVTNTEEKPLVASFLLTVLDNNVQVKAAADTDFKEVLEKTANVTQGDNVKTSLTGRAIVQSDANQTTTVVDKNSEFIVKESGQSKTTIELLSGNLWASVQKLFGKGEYYKVETANSVATVRGTSFGILLSVDTTVLMVSQSAVTFQSVDPVTKNNIGQEVLVQAGFKATIKDGKEPVVEKLTNADKKLPWYVFNQPTVAPSAPGSLVPVKPTTNTTTNTTVTTVAPVSTPTPTPAPVPTPTTSSGLTAAQIQLLSQSNAVKAQQANQANQQQVVPQVQLSFISPSSVSTAQGLAATISLSGQNLNQVTQVLVGVGAIQFSIKDSQTITATITPDIKAGVYDVSVVTSAGTKLTLSQVLTIR